jgi:predicted metal-dependent hydrolase
MRTQGSFIFFTLRVAMLPRTMIEYVVVHELVHLLNHIIVLRFGIGLDTGCE